MPGTHQGGVKAARTDKMRYDRLSPDEPHGFYGKIGRTGSLISRGGGVLFGAAGVGAAASFAGPGIERRTRRLR